MTQGDDVDDVPAAAGKNVSMCAAFLSSIRRAEW